MRPIDGDRLARILERFEYHLINFKCRKAAEAIRAVIKLVKSSYLEIKEEPKE